MDTALKSQLGNDIVTHELYPQIVEGLIEKVRLLEEELTRVKERMIGTADYNGRYGGDYEGYYETIDARLKTLELIETHRSRDEPKDPTNWKIH